MIDPYYQPQKSSGGILVSSEISSYQVYADIRGGLPEQGA